MNVKALLVLTSLNLMLFSGCRVQQLADSKSLDTLAINFRNPAQQYGIRCWWWWLNGNVTKEAITRDLEEMKAKGFSGACIVDAGGQDQQGNGTVPEGPMFGTPAWRELFLHAVNEADRLGLILSLNIQSGWNLGGPDVTPEEATKHLTWSEINVMGAGKEVLLPMPTIRDNFYRDIAVVAFRKGDSVERAPIADLALKAAFVEGDRSGFFTEKLLTDVSAIPNEADAPLQDIIILTDKLTEQGVLHWKIPAGEWTIMRFGFTTSGAVVSTSSGKWKGHVIDYMNAAYFNRYWDTHVDRLLKSIGPMAGKTLRYLQTDSWELGGINWSDEFVSEFLHRRGYSPLAYLPVIAGKIVESRQVSNAFLADFRKTIGECIAENHYRVFAARAREYGMGIQPESAGPHTAPIDGLKNYGYSEIMMSEFWSPSPHRARDEDRFFVKQASSAAQIYNKRLVGAESFTTIGRHWNDVPWATMKPAFDREACSGLNLVFLHTFTCSPKEMGLPGQEYFAGTHLNPNITWWDMAGNVFDYFRRSQYLLQKGTVVADALYYYGDHVPNIGHLKAFDPAKVLPGYDYDLINEDRLMTLTVQDGLIALPHGITYKILSLPDFKILSLKALQKIRMLVMEGATVVGPKPERMFSLSGDSVAFRKYVQELWKVEDEQQGEKITGKGKVDWRKTAREVLDGMTSPDFEYLEKIQGHNFDYIHRRENDIDIYFVSSQNEKPVSGNFAFRMKGKRPELWNALTGDVKAIGFRQDEERTVVPLSFDPYGSAFIVFRNAIPVAGQDSSASPIGYKPVMTLTGNWNVHFDTAMGVPGSLAFPVLESWTSRTEKNMQYYSGKGLYTTTFDFESERGKRYFIVLNNIQDVGIASVKLNGETLGVTWTPPFRIEITRTLKKKNNTIQVEVINSWRNRLVGDRDLPVGERLTKTNITIKPEWELLDAGLLGPVRIEVAGQR